MPLEGRDPSSAQPSQPSDSPHASARTDPDLLYGLLAVREGLVPPELLIQELLARAAGSHTPLARHWLDHHVLNAASDAHLRQLVRQQLELPSPPPFQAVTESDPDSPVPPLPAGAETEVTPTPDADSSNAQTILEPSRLTQVDRPTLAATAVDGSQSPTSSSLKISPDARFRPIRLHATGGLGLVHVAWDRQFGRIVALKEMQARVVNNQPLRDRFLREAQINGNLEYPGIVPVYAIEADENGAPYYAMRFVEGETLHDALIRFHKQAPQLSPAAYDRELRRLLEALLKVCQAIAYAHGRGVLHRDLKPSNIILGKRGETHIIDWGLAKATGQPAPREQDEPYTASATDSPLVDFSSSTETSATLAGQAMGSPPYMSPEQARGEIDKLAPTTDVYSLGATLFAVLTGKPPFEGKNPADILAQVRAGLKTRPHDLDRRIPLPVESISLKAMSFDPADRYQSATSLAADLQHWLADEPVSVHRDSATTRFLRWSRHHKSLVGAATGLVLTALVTLSAATLVVNHLRRVATRASQAESEANQRRLVALQQVEQQRDKATAARQDAELARKSAEQHVRLGLDVIDELITLGDRQLVTPDAAEARRRLLEQALQFLRAFRQRRPDDPDVLADSATAARRLGHFYDLIGQNDQAIPFLQESAALNDSLARAHPDDPRHGDRQAEALLDLAEIQAEKGQVQNAEAQLRATLAAARLRASQNPADRIYQRTLARGLTRLAKVLLLRGQPQDALDTATEAASRFEPIAATGWRNIRQDVAQHRPLTYLDQLEWAYASNVQAQALAALGRHNEAATTLQKPLTRLNALSRLLKDLPPLADLDYFHAALETSLAQILLDTPQQNHAFEALLHLEAAIALLEPLTVRTPEYVEHRAALAEALATRAQARLAINQNDPAREDAELASKHLEDLLKITPDAPDLASLLGFALDTIVRVHLAANDQAAALASLDKAIAFQDQALAANPENPTYQSRRQKLQNLQPTP